MLLHGNGDTRELLVNFHGSTIPRNWHRTWPNLVSMEAVRGTEFYTFQKETDYDDEAPRQNSILQRHRPHGLHPGDLLGTPGGTQNQQRPRGRTASTVRNRNI